VNPAHGWPVDSIRLSAPQAGSAALMMPGDKSISHRAFLISATACGSTRIVGANRGADVRATIAALRALGVRVAQREGHFVVRGKSAFATPPGPIDCQNSGTTMRLLTGMLAGRTDATLDGDASLRRRPMRRVVEPLRRMGAAIDCARGGRAPLRIHAGQTLRGGRFALAVPSAQVASAIEFAALRAQGTTVVVTPARTRNHTELMLAAFGARLRVRGRSITVRPGTLRSPGTIRVPGDLSAATYFMCAAAVVPGASLRLRNVGINPTRCAIVSILRRMGVKLSVYPRRTSGFELVADITVTGGAPLRCVPVAPSIIPQIIDEIPALCALAACARGTLRLRRARELRYKESDRIRTTTRLLQAFGAAVKPLRDGIEVRGGVVLRAPTSVCTDGDHRIGMAAAILAAACKSEIRIQDSACIETSFPDFQRAWRAAFAPARSGRTG
jgi:3-phosphoshikimate 1-carboxyvinyltransferase